MKSKEKNQLFHFLFKFFYYDSDLFLKQNLKRMKSLAYSPY